MTQPDELDAAASARLRAALERLPGEVEPERDLWPSIRARIDQGRVQPLHGGAGGGAGAGDGSRPAGRSLPWYAAPRRLAAAAVLVVALTATATWYATTSREAARMVEGSAAAPAVTPTADPAAALAMFASYERSAADLSASLDRRSAGLDARTRAVLERTLRTIDGAIAEAREALATDPSNPAVQAFVAAAYRQKLDFLRRANDVAADLGS
jgi:hypothetical protein